MYKGKKFLALIPARGGSKGLPRKNLLSLCGKPLVAWSIEKSVSSRYCDETIVNTDDPEIAKAAVEFGAKVPFIRPPELARDKTPMMDVVLHTLDFYNKKNILFDYLVLLEPTSPLRKDNDIDNAIKLLIDRGDKADSIISVGRVSLEHPSIMKNIVGGYVKSYEKSGKKVYMRQGLKEVFFPYGVVYITKINALMKYKAFYHKRTIPYFIERWQNYEIDDLLDFICVEAILKYKLKENAK